MKILILAAGTGSRLMPLTRNTPKSLIDLGEGQTLLETQLEAIKTTGINEIVLLTGYKSEQIESKIESYPEFKFQVVYNPFFDTSNNLVSAWLSKPYLEDDFVLINGDDIFRPRVLQDLMDAEGEIVMVVSHKTRYDDDDMKVKLTANHVQKVSKDLDPNDTDGESIGMIKFDNRGRELFFSELQKMVKVKENLKTYYLQALQNLMDHGSTITYVTCGSEEWAEIDFHPDLLSVQQQLGKKMGGLSEGVLE